MRLRLLVLGFVLFSLTSCFDVFETFNINEDGSGVYEQKMDMGRLMAFATMMGAGKNTEKVPQKMDTTFSYKAVIDTIASLNAEEKAVLGKTSIKMHIDEQNGAMDFTIIYPYASAKEFQVIQEVMAKKETSEAISGAIGKLFGSGQGDMAGMPGNKKTELPTQGFTYALTGNSLVKKVKPSSKTEADATPTSNDGMPAEFKEMMKMSYTTTINLPRPAKNFKGNNGILSADKKQLKFNKTIDADTKLTPADFDFSIDF